MYYRKQKLPFDRVTPVGLQCLFQVCLPFFILIGGYYEGKTFGCGLKFRVLWAFNDLFYDKEYTLGIQVLEIRFSRSEGRQQQAHKKKRERANHQRRSKSFARVRRREDGRRASRDSEPSFILTSRPAIDMAPNFRATRLSAPQILPASVLQLVLF